MVEDVNGDGIPDLLVSDSGSNQVRLLPGVGGGFFNDQDPTIFHVGTTPGPLFVGNFTGNPGQLDLVTVNAGSNDLSLVADINGGNAVAQSIPSGGVFPIAAVEGDFGGTNATSGGNDLLVANNGDGHLALFLSGADGLELAQTFEEPGLPNPTALAVTEDGAIFADNEGVEAAIPVILGLGGTSGTTGVAAGPGRTASGELAAALPDVAGADRDLAERPRRAGGRARSPVRHGRKRGGRPGRSNHGDEPGRFAVRGGRGSGRIARDLDLGTLRGRGQRGRGTRRSRRGRAPQSARAEGRCRRPQR